MSKCLQNQYVMFSDVYIARNYNKIPTSILTVSFDLNLILQIFISRT